jgi:hypothetical protein
MKNWFSRNYKTIIVFSFLIPIITVAIVSISHVTKWYGISNPVTWALYLSVGIEIAALSALAAISADMGRKVYFPFGIVTLIQFIGNIYFAYSFIDVTSQSFISWVELTSPLVEFLGVDPTDLVGHKRFLAFFAGGMLPIISLSFLHMLVKFTQNEKSPKIEEPKVETPSPEPVGEETPVVDAKDIIGEVSRVRLKDEDLELLEKILSKQTKPKVEDTIGENLEELENEFFGELEYLQSKIEATPEPVVELVPEPTPVPPVVEEVIPEPTPEVIIEEIPEPTPVPAVVEEVIPEPTPEVVEETPVVEEVVPVIEEVIEETPVVEEPIIEETPVVEEVVPVIEEVIQETPVVEEVVPEEPIIEETPVVEEPIIEELPTEELPTEQSEEEKKN